MDKDTWPRLQVPLISCIQKIVIYETKARYFVVGSNNTETRFRVMKIDRTEPKELHITDDKVEYTSREIRDLLLMIDVGNRPRVQQKGGNGLTRTVSAFGIVGFVRFLEGYYVVLITKRRKVALVGPHTIYKIEDTSMVYIPNEIVRYTHPDEQRYVKMFQNVDLSSNFYFSYSYDLTHTLQYNLAPCKGVDSAATDQNSEDQLKFWGEGGNNTRLLESPLAEDSVEDANKSFCFFDDDLNEPTEMQTPCPPKPADEYVYGVRNEPSYNYVWNANLLKSVEDQVHPDWLLYTIHGFIAQSNICVFGRPIYVTLIARRSNQFAGTRFLKRGANNDGYVANEVESEQIVHDASVLSLHSGRYTAFTQLRGSIPGTWSQDLSKMVPKPAITLDQSDPYGFLGGQHFNRVLKRYGAPVIILNLVKKREKKRHESILSEEIVKVIQYLNQFLPIQHAIRYIGFDMARVSKNPNSNVLLRLAEIAEYCVKTTGFFQSGTGLHCNDLRPHPRCRGMHPLSCGLHNGYRQRGVVRTNCVDCLDRTNTAQFAMGKCALAFQLYSLGIIDSPQLEFDTDCVRMLEELYEDQGDTLALQYGGSNLVHRIKGYRKIAPWTSSSRDIMQTLSRYYSNAFSDAEKQNALNLFLGVFEPQEGLPNIWDLTTDFYLHNPMTIVGPSHRSRSYTQWWDSEVTQHLPFASEEECKGSQGRLLVMKAHRNDERVDGYWDFYRPYELTSLDEVYCYHVPNSIRDFMPKFASTFSPFTVRVQPGRRQEELGDQPVSIAGVVKSAFKPAAISSVVRAAFSMVPPTFDNHASTMRVPTEHNPNVSGKDSTASINSTGSDSTSTSSSDGSDIEGDIDILNDNEVPHEDSGLSLVSLKDLFPTMEQMYGVEIHDPDQHNKKIYSRYSHIGSNATSHPDACKSPRKGVKKAGKGTNLIQLSILPMDSSRQVEPPKVSLTSTHIYETYVRRGQKGASQPSKWDMKIYHQYLSNKYL